MKRRLRRPRRKGVILLLTAFFMVFFVGLIAFSVDSGNITLARTQLQSAADAAAIAGVDSLSGGTTTSQTAAQTIAQANKAGGASISVVPSSDIEFGTWDGSAATFTVLTGSSRTSANAMRVTCHMSASRSTGLHLFFAPIFGMSSADVSAKAIATQGNGCGPFIGLTFVDISGGSYTDSYSSSAGTYSAGSAGSQGNVCSNGNISLSGGSTIIKGDAHPGTSGTYSASGGSSTTGSTTQLTAALTEAAVDTSAAAASNNNVNIPLSAQGKNPVSAGNFNLSGGDSVTLPSGTYYFAKFTLSGGSTVTINAATSIYTTGDIDISGGSVANTTSIPSNFKLYSSTTGKVTISGSSQMYGVVYAPAADITRSGGNSAFFGSMIGKSLTLSGGGGLHYDTSLGISTSGVQLVQ